MINNIGVKIKDFLGTKEEFSLVTRNGVALLKWGEFEGYTVLNEKEQKKIGFIPNHFEDIKKEGEVQEYDEPSFKSVYNLKGNLNGFIESLGTDEGRIISIAGGVGTGKTTTSKPIAMMLANKLNLPVFFKGLEDDKVPFTRITSIQEVPDNAIIILDEMAETGNSRRSMSNANLELTQLFKEARHHNWFIIYIDQELITTDINLFRRIQILILKEPELFQAVTDRKEIREILQRASKQFKYEDNRPYSYVYSKKYEGMIKNVENRNP